MENTIAIDEGDGKFHDRVGTVEFIHDETHHAFCNILDNMDANTNKILKRPIVTPVVSY